MDARAMKVLQLWMLAAQSGKVPQDQIAGSVYFGITDQPPPPEVRKITTALDLCVYLKEQETGTPLSREERLALARELIDATNSGDTPSLGMVRFIGWLPNISLILAIVAVVAGNFSWLVLGLGLLARFESGFARYLAGQGHRAAGLHIAISLLLVAASIVASFLHFFSIYRFH